MLTGNAIRCAKPREKPYKLFDERGLFRPHVSGATIIYVLSSGLTSCARVRL
jgi:hypothetical protein